MATHSTKCPRCNDDGYVLLGNGNPFAKTIFQLAQSMRRVACDCPAGASYRQVDAYNQAVADETARITR
jgi:hypothetical protein